MSGAALQSLNHPEVHTYSTARNMISRSVFLHGYSPSFVDIFQTPAVEGIAPRFPQPPRSLYRSPEAGLQGPQSICHPHQAPHSSASSVFSIFDPLGIFTSKEPLSRSQVAQTRRTLAKKMGKADSSASEAPSPMVYFPEGESGACQDFSSGGFNTYSFLSFLLSVANLVGLIANNVNNNLNNNNNNDNDNSNNLGNINIANSNSAQNNQNNIDNPRGMGGRKRRNVHVNIGNSTNENQFFKEETAAIIAMDFIRGLKLAMLTSEPSCVLRNMCEVNAEAVKRGQSAKVIAEVFSVALVEMYPRPLPSTKSALLLAGSKGRKNITCVKAYPSCSDALWHQHVFNLEELINQLPSESLTKEMGLHSEHDLLRLL